MPFEALVAQPNCVAVGGGNYCARLCSAALRRREIKPYAPQPKGPFEIVKADVDIALRVVPILRNDVGPRGCEIGHRHLADAEIPILNTRAIAAHVQGIEIVNLDMLATVIALTGPELRIRLALQDMAAAHERFPQTKLVISRVPRKICVARIVSCVRLDHHFRLQPCFVAVVLRVQPVVDENEFSVSFCFVAQAIFRIRAGSLKRDLRSALAVKAISRTEVAVELKALHLLVKFLYLLVRLSEEVIRRLGGNLALKFCADLIGLPEHGFLSCFLGSLFLFRDLLFQSCDALFKLVSGSLVLLFELL